MTNPQIAITPSPFAPKAITEQPRTKAIIHFSRFRPIGRIVRITAVKIVHLLTLLSLLTVARRKIKAFQPQGVLLGICIRYSTFLYTCIDEQ
jgi:hypothetical protein